MSKLKLISTIGTILILIIAGLYLSKNQEEVEITEPQNLKIFEIKDHSMEPALNIDDEVMVDLDYYLHNQPRRNDFIVFKFKTREETFVKRVIGLTGEQVEIKNGVVYINGIEFEEPYAEKDNSNFNLKTISKDSVFVLGDNRDYSFDSRDWGFLPMSRVVGKIIHTKADLIAVGGGDSTCNDCDGDDHVLYESGALMRIVSVAVMILTMMTQALYAILVMS